jgi:hypothetical protein
LHLAGFLFDLGFSLVRTEEDLDSVSTTQPVFLPIELFNKLSGVQQGTLASFEDLGAASYFADNRRLFRGLQAALQLVMSLYPLPASTTRRFGLFHASPGERRAPSV